MPSLLHELPLELFRQSPELIAHLLGDVLQVELPRYREVRVEESDFTELAPTEFRADLVLTLNDETPVMGVVVEVQRTIDPRKRYTWLVYVATLRARLEAPVALLVMTDDEEVARWAREPIAFGPRSVLSVTVFGPGQVPWVRTAEEAIRQPELAVLSALAHGNEPTGLEVVLAALQGLLTLDAERRNLYYDVVLGSLDEATRRALGQEVQMETRKSEYRTELARTNYGKGLADGEARGRVDGEARGRADGEIKALLAVLAARGLVIDEATRERIAGCTDPEQLERWIVRAATASSVAEVFTEQA